MVIFGGDFFIVVALCHIVHDVETITTFVNYLRNLEIFSEI